MQHLAFTDNISTEAMAIKVLKTEDKLSLSPITNSIHLQNSHDSLQKHLMEKSLSLIMSYSGHL